MLPQAQEAVDAAEEQLRAARIEVRGLASAREAKRRQWHFDQQEALAAPSAAKAATARGVGLRRASHRWRSSVRKNATQRRSAIVSLPAIMS